MAIKIEWYKSPIPHSASGDDARSATLHPRLSGNGSLTEEDVVKTLSARNGLSTGAVAGVLAGLVDILKENLTEGRTVHVGDLGFFSPALCTTERITQNTPRKVEKINVCGVNFRAEKALVNALGRADFQRTKNPIHSTSLTDEDIEEGFKCLFAENRFITRIQVQDYFNLTTSTACRLVKRLVTEHKLVNVGSKNSPIYQHEVGCFE
jgi:predicted histone-like DNA-binding protein